jgi:hypothetical protein
VFVLLEDLHWADAGTLELLDYLADKLEGSRVVVVVTTRAGEGLPAERLAHQLRARGDGEVVEAGRLAAAGVAPPGTLLGVARLAFPELMVELEATAVA